MTDDDIKFVDNKISSYDTKDINEIINKYLPDLTVEKLSDEQFDKAMIYYGNVSNSILNEMFKEIEEKLRISQIRIS